MKVALRIFWFAVALLFVRFAIGEIQRANSSGDEQFSVFRFCAYLLGASFVFRMGFMKRSPKSN